MGFPQTPFGDRPQFEPEKIFTTPLGAASPLWLAFMGAASAGAAFWWMTRWARPINVEAGAAAKDAFVEPPVPEAAAFKVADAVAEAVAEALEPLDAPVEAQPPAMAEPVAAESGEAEPAAVETAEIAPDAELAAAAESEPPATEVAPEIAPEPVVEALAVDLKPEPAPKSAPAPVAAEAPELTVASPAKKKPVANAARVSARTKRRQPGDAGPKGPTKRH